MRVFKGFLHGEKMGISEKIEDGLFLENEVFRLEEEIRKSTRIFLGHSGRRRGK